MARRLAREMGLPLEALAIGPRGEDAAGILSSYGVSFLHVADHERLGAYAPEAWAHTVLLLVEAAQPAVVMGTGSDRGAEVMAHVGARLGLPLASTCNDGKLPLTIY